ncbi:sialomucin core protein 24-like [Hyposmocoma kahamanoa]|uniref:sialomucin core protein 24-like n=1 Tax=Hyposmocoma kahamanoa TaxID=1477025 RepID=UPI000E6D94C6|nr:sialomucin core protein 24-like [Hyposmocoma kahamanoa]
MHPLIVFFYKETDTQKPPEASPTNEQKSTELPLAPTVKPDSHPENKQPTTVVPTTSNNITPVPTGGKTEKTEQSTKDGTTHPAPAPTTPKPVQSSTAPPSAKPTQSSDAPLQARGFDGASFIGGIILTLGLLAIGFMGFKYYKNQTERNYHTL